MRQTIHCLQQARNMDQVCSRIFEVIHHKTIDKEYEPNKPEREAIYNLLNLLDCYETKHIKPSQEKNHLHTQAPQEATIIHHVINPVIEHEIDEALSNSCKTKTQGARLLKNLLHFLINDRLPGANLNPQEIRLAKSALFDISLRANQLIEPDSY